MVDWGNETTGRGHRDAGLLIRPARDEDVPAILALYDAAHDVMARSGNPTQWDQGYPGPTDIEADRAHDALFVAEQDGEVSAVLCYAPGPDPTYAQIEGAWLNDAPYHVVHRIASREGSGIGRACLAWACGQGDDVRIDTHEDNAPMRHVLTELGFVECGTIICDKGTPRVAYQHLAGQRPGEAASQ